MTLRLFLPGGCRHGVLARREHAAAVLSLAAAEGRSVIGRTLAHYRIAAAIGAGGPPPLAHLSHHELRRDRAEALAGTR